MLHEKSDNEGNTDNSEDGNLYDPKYISENMAGLQITAFFVEKNGKTVVDFMFVVTLSYAVMLILKVIIKISLL